MFKSSFFYIFIIFLLIFSGCNKESSFFHPDSVTEVLIDSKVIGIEYKNLDQTYTTNDNGEFTFTKNSTVIFQVGNVIIGQLSTQSLRDDKKRFIQELTNTSSLRDTNNTKTLNIAVFLQSLDDDDNLTNGITLSKSCIDNFRTIDSINIQDANDSHISQLIALCGKTTRSRSDALLHLNTTMTEHGIDLLAPNVVSLSLINNPPIDASVVQYEIVFDENITNISKNDFNLTFTGTTNAIIDSISNSFGKKVEIIISDISGEGSLQLNLKDNHSITDTSSNNLIGGFSGQVHTNSTPPKIVSVTIPSNSIYKENDSLDFNITISENIYLSSIPRLILDIDGQIKYANYKDGNGSNYLSFEYVVENNLTDNDGITLSNYIDTNGTTIKDLDGNDLNSSFLTQDLSGIIIDSINPYITNITIPQNGYYKSDDTLTFLINTNENVTINNTPYLLLTIDSIQKQVPLVDGNNTSILEFSYTLPKGIEDKNGLELNTTIILNGATIKDQGGNDINLTLPDVNLSNIFIDSLAPFMKDISNDQNGTHGIDKNLSFYLEYNEELNITGTPKIEIFIDGMTNQYALYEKNESNSTNIKFKYTIQSNILDLNGISMNNSIELNGSTIKDLIGNDANLSINSINLSNVYIDSKSPVFDTNTSLRMCENEVKIVQLNASDTAPSISFDLKNNLLDSNLTEINSSAYLKFKIPPDFNTSLDYNKDNIYEIVTFATDTYGNESNQTIQVEIVYQEDESNLYIKDIIYDDNLTQNVNDDILYIYFSKQIDEDSLDLNNLNNMFQINGNGDFNNTNATYSNELFNSIKIELNNGSSTFDIEDTNLSIKPNTIKDKCGVYPLDYNETKVNKKQQIVSSGLKYKSYNDTGNINSKDTNGNFYGDDKYYNIYPDRNYTRDDINQTVIDNITKLMWQDDTNVTDKLPSTAINYCNNLNLSGYTNWRAPKIDELATIVYYNNDPLTQWIDTKYFKNHKGENYWSSTQNTNIDNEDRFWLINFNNNNGEIQFEQDINMFNTRCVRNLEEHNVSFSQRYVKNTTYNIILDKKTTLIWQDTDALVTPIGSWSNAIRSDVFEGCETLSLAGFNDWRLPTINELQTIIDYSKVSPTVNENFSKVQNGKYWSSTTADNETYAWYINFFSGEVKKQTKSSSDSYAICVRNR